MDLLDIVSTVLEISQNRESYGDEIQSLQETLGILQRNLKRLGPDDVPIELATSIRSEVERSSELLQNIPKKAGIFNVLTSKLPGSTLQQLKEKKDKLTHLSRLLSDCLIASMVPQQQQQHRRPHTKPAMMPTIIEPEFVPTMYDPNLPEDGAHDHIPRVLLLLRVEPQIKETFIRYDMNLKEDCPCQFTEQETCEVFRFQRQYYHKMANDIDQINTISRDHAIITAKRVLKKQAPRKPSQEQKEGLHKDADHFIKPISKNQHVENSEISERKSPQPEDVFQTCQEFDASVLESIRWEHGENVNRTGEEHKQYEYTFFLQNLGQMGTFIYKTPQCDQKTPAKHTGAQVWTRISNKDTVEIHEGDRVALLMQKPQYKSPLISYEFTVKYPLPHSN